MNLFSANLAALLATLTGGLVTFLFTQKSSKKDRRKLIYCLGGALILAILLQEIFVYADQEDKLPSLLWLMILPVTLSITAIIYYFIKSPLKTFKKRYYIPVLASTFLLSIALSLISINLYYHYFPTIASVFGLSNRQEDLLKQQATTIQLAPSSKGPRTSSVEASLYSHSEIVTSGTITELTIPGEKSHFKARKGYVYTPAAALTPARINLPVLILTAGVPGDTTSWLNGTDFKKILDTFAAQHHGITPYVFLVDNLGSGYNDTECVDSTRGNVETYLSQDVPHYIKDHYEVTTDPSGWGIGGLSLGGFCGIMLTLRHTDVYSTFLDLGGDNTPGTGGTTAQTIKTLFNGSKTEFEEHSPLELLAKRDYPTVSGYFAIGKQDKKALVDDMKTLFDATQKAKVQSVFEQIGGEHSFSVWAQGFADALPWLSNRLGATQCPGKCN